MFAHLGYVIYNAIRVFMGGKGSKEMPFEDFIPRFGLSSSSPEISPEDQQERLKQRALNTLSPLMAGAARPGPARGSQLRPRQKGG